MGDCEFVLFIDLGERGFIGWEVKDRVVAESAIAGRCMRDSAFNGANRFKHNAIAVDDGDCADESCGSWSIGILCKPLEDRGEALWIGCVRPEESGRSDTWLAIERIDDEAGVFGYGQKP